MVDNFTQQQLRALTSIQRQQIEEIGYPSEIIRPKVEVPKISEIAGSSPQKDWEGLKLMLERGKTKSGFGQKAVKMYEAVQSPTSNISDLMLKQGILSPQEHKVIENIRHTYRASVSAGKDYRESSVSIIEGQIIDPSMLMTTQDIDIPEVYGPQLPSDRQVTQQYSTPSGGYSTEKGGFSGVVTGVRGLFGKSAYEQQQEKSIKQFEKVRTEDTFIPTVSGPVRIKSEPIFIETTGKDIYDPDTFFGKLEERFHELPSGEQLPYGLEPTPERLSGEEFSIRYPHLFVSRRFVESPMGEELISRIEERFPGIEKVYPAAPYLAPIIEELPTFAVFSPFFRTGAAAKSVQSQISKGRFEALGKKITKDLLKKKKGEQQAQYLINLAKKYVKNPTDKDEFAKFVVKLYEQGIFKGIPVDFYTEQAVTQPKLIVDLLRELPQMKGVGVITGSVTGIGDVIIGDIGVAEDIRPEDVRQVEWFGETEVGKIRETVWTKELRDVIAPLSMIKPLQKPLTKTQQKQLAKQQAKQAPRYAQPSAQTQAQRLKQIARPRYGLSLAPGVATSSVFGTPQIFRQPTRPKKIPKGKFPYFPKEKESKKLKKKLKKRQELFQPFTRRYGKWQPIGEPQVQVKAVEAGLKRVRGTLAATLQLRTVKGQVVPFEVPAEATKFFRPGKRDPYALVQRRGERLAAIGERKEILRARRGVNFFK